MVNFDNLIEKIKEISNKRTVEEVAEIIEVKANTLRKKNINSIPYQKLIKFTENYKINLNWLLNDEGEKFLKDESTQKKIIKNDNGTVNVNTGGKGKFNSTNTINYNSKDNSNDNQINEIINIYKKLPPIEQKKLYHKLKIQELEMLEMQH